MLYKVTLNGKVYEVDVEKGDAIIQDEYDLCVPQAPQAQPSAQPVVSNTQPQPATAAPAAGANSANAIKAPLPGNINAINVSTGQDVKEGDVLIILEAMKMENEIVAPKAGKIGKIFVQKGAVVETDAPLIEIL